MNKMHVFGFVKTICDILTTIGAHLFEQYVEKS